MNATTYRFRIIAGPQSGKSFSVGDEGALIGRSENCDVIILDPSLSRHHCRLFQRDGLLRVADLKSANSTSVDDKPMQEAPLWKDRRITIGDTVIIVESDTGVRHPSQPTPAGRPLAPFITIGGILSIAAIALFAYILRPPSRASDPYPPADAAATPFAASGATHLALDYYRIHADTGTIRTTHFQILPPAVATILVEDLATKREMRRTVTMPRYQIELLAKHFNESGFFALSGMPDITDQPAGIRISALVHDRLHTVRSAPQSGSASFRSLAAEIEATAALLFGNWIKDFSDANLTHLAAQRRRDAQALAGPTQRDRHNHLYKAIEHLEYAAWLLQPIRPEPALLDDIRQMLHAYTRTLDDYVRERFSEADLAFKHNDVTAEATALRMILADLPNDQDVRYRAAASRLAKLEQEGGAQHAP